MSYPGAFLQALLDHIMSLQCLYCACYLSIMQLGYRLIAWWLCWPPRVRLLGSHVYAIWLYATGCLRRRNNGLRLLLMPRCPRPGCGQCVALDTQGSRPDSRAVAAGQRRPVDVQCACGERFCLSCGLAPHEPAPCAAVSWRSSQPHLAPCQCIGMSLWMKPCLQCMCSECYNLCTAPHSLLYLHW